MKVLVLVVLIATALLSASVGVAFADGPEGVATSVPTVEPTAVASTATPIPVATSIATPSTPLASQVETGGIPGPWDWIALVVLVAVVILGIIWFFVRRKSFTTERDKTEKEDRMVWFKKGKIPTPDEVTEAQQRLAHFDTMASAARAGVDAIEARFAHLVVATNLAEIMPDNLRLKPEQVAEFLQEQEDPGQEGEKTAPLAQNDKGHQALERLVPARRDEAKKELARLETARWNLAQWEAVRLSYRQHCRRVWPNYFK